LKRNFLKKYFNKTEIKKKNKTNQSEIKTKNKNQNQK
jgi:hypothetical protein